MIKKDIEKELPLEQIQALHEAEIAFKKNPTLIPLDEVMKEVELHRFNNHKGTPYSAIYKRP